MHPIPRDPQRYSDMLHLPHHSSPNRPRMSRLNRAAQFAPFDALSGYGAAIRETARTTEQRAELDDSAKHRLNCRLQQLLRLLPQQPEVTITWFCPDSRKSGGSYQTVSGRLEKIDGFQGTLLLTDGTQIPVEQLRAIDSDRFSCLDDLA